MIARIYRYGDTWHVLDDTGLRRVCSSIYAAVRYVAAAVDIVGGGYRYDGYTVDGSDITPIYRPAGVGTEFAYVRVW